MKHRITLADAHISGHWEENGPCEDEHGNKGFSLFIEPRELQTEVILYREEIAAMLAAIDDQFPPS